MPIYKQLPRTAQKKAQLPFYRPIDRLIVILWNRRRQVAPYLIGAFVVFVAAVAWKGYSNHRESEAWELWGEGKVAEVIRDAPRSTAALFARLEEGRKAIEENRLDDAALSYEAVLKRHPRQPLARMTALQNLALVHRLKGEWEKAVSLLKEAEVDPANPDNAYTRRLREDTEKKWQESSPLPPPSS